MATVSKVNSDLIARGGWGSTLQLQLFKLVIPTAYAVTSDTQAGGAGTAITEGTARKVMQELGTTAALYEIASDGEEIVVVGDGHALDVNAIATRVGRILLGSEGAIDGAGVYKTAVGGTTVVTVTAPESFASLMA